MRECSDPSFGFKFHNNRSYVKTDNNDRMKSLNINNPSIFLCDFSCFFREQAKMFMLFFVYFCLFFKHIQILLRCYCPRLNRIRLRPDLCSGNHEHIFPFQQRDHHHHSMDNQRRPNSYCLFPTKYIMWMCGKIDDTGTV